VVMEDYCHAIEHSIEFQILFLQHLYGPGIRILPILCGPFVRSLYEGGKPEDDPEVNRFLEALGEIAAREGKRLLWVLGIDMAHIGRRYGDSFAAQAQRGVMETVAARDQARLERIAAGDADGFWEEVRRTQDDLRWCGASALYTLMKAALAAHPRPLIWGVTVLTSFSAEHLKEVGLSASAPEQVLRLAALAQGAGLDGLVCSPQEASLLRQNGIRLTLVTPGIQYGETAGKDQRRTASPQDAWKAGADYIVVGRGILNAQDPARTANDILKLRETL